MLSPIWSFVPCDLGTCYQLEGSQRTLRCLVRVNVEPVTRGFPPTVLPLRINLAIEEWFCPLVPGLTDS